MPNEQLAEQTVIELAAHMGRLKDAAAQFAKSNNARERGYFSPSEDDQVLHLWVSYHMARNALLERIAAYKKDASGNMIESADFVLAFAAVAVLVDAGRFLRELFIDEPVVRRKLNESFELFNIPANSFDAIQMSLSDPMHAVQIYQATQFYDEHLTQLNESAAGNAPLQEILSIIDKLVDRLRVSPTAYAKARVNVRTRHTYDRIVRSGFGQAVYAIQSWVSLWVGKLSTSPTHRPALPENIKAELLDLLLPGDVLVTRKEHSLTNYFLPGYWPHVALYIGEGRVIEALADGVRERSVDSPFAVDAIATIRPLLSAHHIAQAIDRAHTHVGKPYDFDFDFTRADRMVCTEVVYRGFEGIGNVSFQLTRRAARETLSAEDLLNLARRQEHFSPLALFCPLHSQKMCRDQPMDSILQATMAS